jgi:hypothetical protein
LDDGPEVDNGRFGTSGPAVGTIATAGGACQRLMLVNVLVRRMVVVVYAPVRMGMVTGRNGDGACRPGVHMLGRSTFA